MRFLDDTNNSLTLRFWIWWQALQDFRSSAERCEILARECTQLEREVTDTALSSCIEDRLALLSGMKPHYTSIVRVRLTTDAAIVLERGNQAADGRHLHLLRAREIANRDWPAKDDHRESRESCRA